MKRSLITLAATIALLAGAPAAAQAATTCYTITVPAVPAVYEAHVTPAVTVTEHEYVHAQDGNGNGQGQGPANRWEAEGWNAESNPASIGWAATGNTRVRVLEVEKTETVLVSAEVPATTYESCVELPDGVSPVPVGAPEVPLGNLDPAPVAVPEAPAPAQDAAPLAVTTIDQAAPVAAPAPVEELAYTGAADWVLPAGLGLLALGAATVAARRSI